MSRQAPARHFRQFMEWAKSVLASQALSKGDCLVELCVGKGLDAGKWERAGVARGLFLEPESDESSVSLAEAEERWLKKGKKYEAQFSTWDGTADGIPAEWRGMADAVTCHMRLSTPQFLDSRESTEAFFAAAAAALRPGGLLFGIMIDPSAVWYQVQKGRTEGNEGTLKVRGRAFTLTFDATAADPEPFGTRFRLRAEDGRGAEETYAMAHVPSLIAAAESQGFEYMEMMQLTDLYEDNRYHFGKLLSDMRLTDKNSVGDCFDLVALHTTYVFKKKV